MNIENMLKLLQFLQKEGEFAKSNVRFNMNMWVGREMWTRRFKSKEAVYVCGTPACLAGSAVLACGTVEDVNNCNSGENDYQKLGAELLGLEGDDSYYVNPLFDFELSAWPSDLAQAYRKARTSDGRRKIAIALVKRLICEELKVRSKDEEGTS